MHEDYKVTQEQTKNFSADFNDRWAKRMNNQMQNAESKVIEEINY
jgi:hypothetical protein